MPSFPGEGSVTICEINRDLITSDTLSDEVAKETYGKLLGLIFTSIPFQPQSLTTPETLSSTEQTNLSFISTIFKNHFFKHPIDLKLLESIEFHHGVDWHKHKHILAFISGSNEVSVHDFEDKDCGKSPHCVLVNEVYQKDVTSIAWRPNGGKVIAVGCKGGVCIWGPWNSASSVRSSVVQLGSSNLSRGSGAKWTLVDFLASPDHEQITALSWSPNGRYLASASFESSSFIIWDVAQGEGTPVRRGLGGGISLLRWSPSGDYFFAAKFDGTFYLWETNTWTSEPWSSTNGFVTGAAWDPDGSKILVAFSESSTLGSVHFATRPPSLDAHLIPVELLEIQSLTGSQGIDKMAWDASGERLAVSYREGNELYRGLIAIYDVRRSPLISASLVGFIRGPGDDPKPIAFSFHDKFKQGPLLSVCWSSGFCCTYPLIFRSHVLP